MAIRKAKVNSGFTVMLNKSMQDKNLSFEATGLLAMMLSLPDDWDIHKSWLQLQKQKCGRDKLTSMMKELIDAGYVVKRFKQKDDGRMDGVDWFVYPEPVTEKQSIELENRTTVNPASGEDDTTKNTSLQNKQKTKGPLSSASLKDDDDDTEKKKPTRKQRFTYDKERIKATWNAKAEEHGLPKINAISATVEKGLIRLYHAHVLQCKQLGETPNDIDDLINGYIQYGYEPTDWAKGANPTGKKYGITTALTQQKIDEILDAAR